DGLDDQYVQVFNLIQEADGLSGSQPTQALSKYGEAQTILQRLQKGSPDWNAKVVSFRLNYLANKIAELTKGAGAAALTATNQTSAAGQPAKPAVPSDWDLQLSTAKEQARQLQAEKVVLEAKLKEAFSIQPAQVDPRELTKAEEKIKSLQKETDLLKVALDQEKGKSKAAPVADTKALDQAQQTLTEANRKLAAETERATLLAQEKKALQNKLENLMPIASNAASIEKTRKALEETTRQLNEQKELATKLAAEKDALQGRIKTLGADADAAAALRAENQLLKKQLTDSKASAASTDKAEDTARQLAQAQAQIAALQSDKELLRLEKTTLESRVKQLSATTTASTVLPDSDASEMATRFKQLERERDDLEKKLEAANKELYGRKGKAVAAHVEDLENQLTIARARLEIFEARQIPYSAEELTLFKKPELTLAEASAQAGQKSAKELSPGAAKLIAEAKHHFAARDYEKAEEAYQQVLREDAKSVPALADLATIQMERNHLDAAEANLKQAVTLDPNNAYSLSVLGYLKFRQRKFDEALDALSRAAKQAPQNAEIQNYLGLTLSEKGLRGPAETALRKAIQLQPNYASAHNNLAVVYATQQPPATELARWHYQKALAAGHPRNTDLEKLLEPKR
ncbi:MAG TPA: tetratricopeptide repeat protein, partial [Candidatus Sulfotelmatobacter sp.]|nr:tetratricopeptide repeat protein [Candidatus Sulfotelmatobacter sp.]